MFVLLNVLVLGMVLMIAYWWANQGVFSAILHLLCVIVAGTIALAFWEPLMYKVLLNGNYFDNYAWGLSLIVLFLVSLLVLRVIMDKAIPSNTRLPHWADLAFGAPVGAVSGVLTVGLFIIGAGFIQSAKDPFGYAPWGRSARTGQIAKIGPSLWIPVDQIASEFYGLLSVTSLSTSTPLRHVNPDLWIQASLLRDSYGKGKGMISLKPAAAKVTNALFCTELNSYAVQVDFSAQSRDFGSQLSLSRAQIRLVEDVRGARKPVVAYPDSWTQPNGHFSFDDVSHYITSESGQQSVSVTMFFPANQMSGQAKYIQIRNTRYLLPRIQTVPPDRFNQLDNTSAVAAAPPDTTIVLGGSIASVITLSSNPRPISASKNAALGSLELLDDKFFKGENTFPATRGRGSRKLAIDGLYEPPGTRIVQLEIRRGGPADIYSGIDDKAGDKPELMLVDDQNRTYWPMGYIHLTADTYKLKLDPINFIKTPEQLPILSSNGTQTLRLLFVVTQDVTITRFQYGNVVVGTCNVQVVPET